MLLNLERARAFMAEHELDAIVASSAENVTYSSGFANWTIYTFKNLETYVVIPREGELSLVAPIDASDYLAQCPAMVSRLYSYGRFHTEVRDSALLTGAEAKLVEVRAAAIKCESAQAGLRRALAESGVLGGKIGIDEQGMTQTRWNGVVDSLAGTSIQEASALFRSIRMIKTEDEIDRLRVVARAVEQGMQAAFALAAPNVTEKDLEFEFRKTVVAAGATPGHFETSAGTRSAGCFPSSDNYRIRRGDVVRSDAGGWCQGYWADTGRTIAVGPPDPDLSRYFDALQQGFVSMLTLVKPGTAVSDLFQIGVQTVRDGGIAHYQRHHVGHAIGLEMYEAPILVGADGSGDIHQQGSTVNRLEEGMVLNLELPYYELGLGGLQIEETLVVRPNGYELLTSAQRELRIHETD